MGVPRSARLDRAAAHPRLPRAEPDSFDGRGNYSLGIREQIIFPEIDYDSINQIRGLDVAITTTATNDVEARSLLDALGFPFAAGRRESLVAKKSLRVKAARPAKFKVRNYTRCNRCGRPRAVFRSSGSAGSACGSSPTRA